MNGEVWGVGRTFILAILGLILGFVLLLTGTIPGIISLGEWTTFIGALTAVFAAKSIGHAVANKK